MQLRNYQAAAVDSIFDYFENGGTGNPVVALPTGCHAIGQELLMYDGTLKRVEDIVVDDLLMGPDSNPRRVLSLCRGRQEMRRIVPVKGDPWIVNKDHILALYRSRTSNKKHYPCNSSGYFLKTVNQHETDSRWQQYIHKLYRVAVNFQNKDQLIVNPYFLGIFLGDGSYTQSQVRITSMDPEILNYCTSYLETLGDKYGFNSNGSRAVTLRATTKIRNPTRRTAIADLMDKLGLRGKDCYSKFIPQVYKTSSRGDRLLLLAGLLDTDGHYDQHGFFEYTTVSEHLANGVAFVARTLGFAAIIKKKPNYYRLGISGDLDLIPTQIPHKKAKPRKQIKNVLHTGFAIESLPEDDYYGFELDGDRLYLLGDMTVTHNTGKSHILAAFIHRAIEQYPGTRIIKLTHIKEIIQQNLNKLLAIWPTAPAGVFSAGLGRKEYSFPITFGGVGSVARCDLTRFGRTDLLLIDECNLVSPKESTMYQKIIDRLLEINPHLKVIGFTATQYRLGYGLLTEGTDGLFTDVCFDMTGIAAFNWLLAEGYLVPPIPRRTSTILDISGVRLAGGEYKQNELQQAVDKEEITYAAVQEILAQAGDRQHWLIFASGIEHAIHVADTLEAFGVPTTCVHSKMLDHQRDEAIAGFISGKYRAITNNGILTTGFDFPGIDLIGVLRPTQSPGLWVQMLGRSTRPVYAPGYDLLTTAGRLAAIANSPKRNALILDFAGNTRRLGPINDPVLPKRKGMGTGGPAPVKICEACGTYNHASVRYCISCNAEFPKHLKIATYASTDELLADGEPRIEIFKVDRVTYKEHHKKGRPNTVQVSYFCGLRRFREWLCFSHPGYPGHSARKWYKLRATDDPPKTTEEAIMRLDRIPVPKEIAVRLKSKGYDEILSASF